MLICRWYGVYELFEKEAIMRVEKYSVAHVLSWETGHLNVRIARVIDQSSYDVACYLRDVNGIFTPAEGYKKNKQWIEGLGRTVFRGLLQKPLLTSWLPWIRVIISDFSLLSWIRLLMGPRDIVFHGFNLEFITILILRCFRKRVAYINWAGPPRIGRYKGFLDKIGLRMLWRIYVLMSPEIKYYARIVSPDKVKLLPYPLLDSELKEVEECKKIETCKQKVLLLGNSTWLRYEYETILDKIDIGSWDKIICMLNYGRESEQSETKAFITKYHQKFGDSFFAWTETVSSEEYLSVIKTAPYYICPAKTQSGLGLLRYSIMQGKAIFICGDNFDWYKNELGLDVFNLNAFENYNYSTLCDYLPSNTQHRKRLCLAADYWKKSQSVSFWTESIKLS